MEENYHEINACRRKKIMGNCVEAKWENTNSEV